MIKRLLSVRGGLASPLHLQRGTCSMSHLVTGKRQPKSLSRVPHAIPHCPLPQHIKCRERHFQRVCCTAVMLKVLRRQRRTREFGIQPCAHPALQVSTQQSHRTSAGPSRSSIPHPAGALPARQPWCSILILHIHWYATPVRLSLIPTSVAKAESLKTTFPIPHNRDT